MTFNNLEEMKEGDCCSHVGIIIVNSPGFEFSRIWFLAKSHFFANSKFLAQHYFLSQS